MTYTILIVLLWVTVHAIRKAPARVRRPRLEYRPEWYEPETVDLEPFEDDQDEPEPATEGDFKRVQAQIDIEHWESQKNQAEALKLTYAAEIKAIRINREKKAKLPTLVDRPIEYMELAASIEKRDDSERREAQLQRAIMTADNRIYACNKKIAKAQQILKGV